MYKSVFLLNGVYVAEIPEVFLYADIWLSLDEPQTLEQVCRMNKNLKAVAVYFWGQEVAIYAGIERRQGKNVDKGFSIFGVVQKNI